MGKMLFDSKQSPVAIVSLPNGMYDVIVLDNEKTVTIDPPEMGGEKGKPYKAYQYDGNVFRTVYELKEEDILKDVPKWLNYTTDEEPTVEQLQHDNELIDKLTMELIEGGIL